MRRSWLLSVFILCISCSRPIPELNGVDLSAWKNDFKGCMGTRSQYLKALDEQRDKLKGLSEIDLVKLLGKPDRNELSEHHEKTYSYFIDPAMDCGKGDSTNTTLEVHFNATGVSNEVVILSNDL